MRFVGALVRGLPPRQPGGARDPRGCPDVATYLEGVAERPRGGVGQPQRRGAQPLGRPGRLEAPVPAHLAAQRVGRGGSLLVHDDRRLPVDAVVDALQPPVEPPEHLGLEIDVGPRPARLGGPVGPRAQEQPRRRLHPRERPQRDVRVAVRPAADDHRRRTDPLDVLARRAVPPVVVAVLVRQPRQEPRLVLLEAALPFVAPAVAPQRRHRWQRVHRHHVRRVVDDVELFQGAAVVVDVVGVAVVGGEDRHDRLERRRLFQRHLQRVEAAVAGAEHADRAQRPGLCREPVDHPHEVVALRRRVLVGGDPARGARAADVEPAHHVPAVGQRGVVPAPRAHVVLAIGERVQQGGPRPLARIRKEQRRRQLDAVGHLDPDLFASSHATAKPIRSDPRSEPHDRADMQIGDATGGQDRPEPARTRRPPG